MQGAGVIVVGGGLAGLMATIQLAEQGVPVKVFSLVPCKRSHSVCAQGGINAAVNTKGEGDSPWQHFDDTVYGGDFLANQTLVKGMCEAGPGIVHLLDRMGVMFNRTPEGLLDFRRFGGTRYRRSAYAGATTGQQLIYALDDQVRRHEVSGRVERFERWEFLSLVLHQDRCVGIVAQNLHDMGIQAFSADAVILCTGGPGAIFGRSTNSQICTGSAASIAYQQGAWYANGEFIQVHPTAIPGEDKNRLISESVRAEGGRVWVPKDPRDARRAREIPEEDRFHYLEEWYPEYGNLVPRDIASRAAFKVVYDLGLGVRTPGDRPAVYLDISHKPDDFLRVKLGAVLELYQTFVGVDPYSNPMMVFPSVHYSMGGLWVENTIGTERDHMTNIPGLYAAGEVDYQYHGANRLGANSLLSCIYGGKLAGLAAARYRAGRVAGEVESVTQALKEGQDRQQAEYEELLKADGTENAFALHLELGDHMSRFVTVRRDNHQLRRTDGKILELLERWENLGLSDRSRVLNQELLFARTLKNMLKLARVITLAALRRDESRGAHYKAEAPMRDDGEFLHTTIASHSPDGVAFSQQDVDLQHIPPRTRTYGGKEQPTGAAAT